MLRFFDQRIRTKGSEHVNPFIDAYWAYARKNKTHHWKTAISLWYISQGYLSEKQVRKVFKLLDHIYKIRDLSLNNIQVESVQVYVDEENILCSGGFAFMEMPTKLWFKYDSRNIKAMMDIVIITEDHDVFQTANFESTRTLPLTNNYE